MKPLISVIVPVYNVEKYLAACLDSLISQTFKETIILCINDGSTDHSGQILEKYQNEYPQKIIVYTNKNSGIAATRNFGLAKVETEYFAFLDSDDTAEPKMLELMYDKAISSDADLVMSDFYWSLPNSEFIKKDGPYQNHKELLTGMFATLWNKLYKTSFVKSLSIQFPVGYRYEDASFLYKLIPHLRKWAYIEIPFVHYLQREGSITHNHNERVKDMVYVFKDLLKYYRDHYFFDQYKNELEFLFVRFFLGNSFIRTCQIQNKKDRNLTLKLSYEILFSSFPNWKSNTYIKINSSRNIYYKSINKITYKLYAFLFNLRYKF